jgi:hypothetical protein
MEPGLSPKEAIMRIIHVLALGLLSAIALPVSPSTADSPATSRPEGRNVNDYCTVILSAKLQDFLVLTDAQRPFIAEQRGRLDTAITRAANLSDVSTAKGEAGIVERGQAALAPIGQDIKDKLTAQQVAALEALFAKGTLKPIEIHCVVKSGVRGTGHSVGRITTAHVHTYSYGVLEMVYSSFKDANTPGERVSFTSRQAAEEEGSTSRPEASPEEVDQAVSDLKNKAKVSDGLRWANVANIKDREQIAKILAALRPVISSDEGKRNDAIKAFCRFAGPQEVAELDAMGRLTNAFLPIESIVAALGKLDPKKAVTLAEERCSDLGLQDQLKAGLVAAPVTESAILPLLASIKSQARQIGCDALGDVGTEKCIPALQKLADASDSDSFFVKPKAKAAIAKIKLRLVQQKS